MPWPASRTFIYIAYKSHTNKLIVPNNSVKGKGSMIYGNEDRIGKNRRLQLVWLDNYYMILETVIW